MCQIMIRMIYTKEMFNVLADWFIWIWGNISHKNLQMDLRFIFFFYMSNCISLIKRKFINKLLAKIKFINKKMLMGATNGYPYMYAFCFRLI